LSYACKARHHRPGQQGDAILSALAVPNEYLLVTKVDILDAQPETFAQAQPGPVQQVRHQPLVALLPSKDAAHFVHSQHSGAPGGAFGALQSVKPRQWQQQNFFVEEQDGRERLVLRCGSHIALSREMIQKCSDFQRAHLRRVALVMEVDKPPDPMDVGTFGPQAVMPSPYGVPYLLD
jgi:hypothetical protein